MLRVGQVFVNQHIQELKNTYWPWGAGMFATSLGPRFLDHGQLNLFECVVQKQSGGVV